MNIRLSALALVSTAALCASGMASSAGAQAVAATTTPASATAAPAVAPAPSIAAPVPAGSIRIPEGTEVHIAIEDALSSKTSSAGDQFAFRTTDPIRLADGTVLAAGYGGRGEVTDVEKKGMLGKAGQLNVRLDYIAIGDAHVRLRTSAGVDGKSGVGATVALALIISPLFLMHHGADAIIPKGHPMTAFVDQDTVVVNPPAPPVAS